MIEPNARAALELTTDVLIRIRFLALRGGSPQEIAALADSVHNTPKLVAHGLANEMAWLIEDESMRARGLLRKKAMSMVRTDPANDRQGHVTPSLVTGLQTALRTAWLRVRSRLSRLES